jgi:chromosome partitioning protein
MARVISICNQKGGVGKTTTAVNLSSYLGMLGHRTLLIDFDPQFNATVGVGVRPKPDQTIYHALLAGLPARSAIVRTYLANLDLAPASSDLAGALVELVDLEDREWRLRQFVDAIRADYDFIIIDLAPSLNLLTINGLLASDEVIVPVQCEYYSLEGLGQLLETINLIRENIGHPLKIGGALLTMYDRREKLSREVAKEIRRRFPHRVYDVEIPRSVSLAEAPSFQKPIMLYAPHSPGAVAYERLAREVLIQGGMGVGEVLHPATGAIAAQVTRKIEDISKTNFDLQESPEPLIIHYAGGEEF